MLRSRWAEERGVAIITAMLVSMVVLTLGVTSVTIALHNTEQSAYDRRRVTSVAAAEAGVNYYFSHLQSVDAANMQCSITESMTGTPVSSFTATAIYYDANGSTIACPPTSTTPVQARIRSVGTTSGQTTPSRTMEALVTLVPIAGGIGSFGEGAIFADSTAALDSNVTILGDGAINADVYSNSAIVIDSNTVVNGSVYGQSSLNMNSNSRVKGNAWVKNAVTMDSNSIVDGNVTSSTSSISVLSSAHVYGNAQAGTTISGSSRIDGTESPNSPSAAPPARTFPTYTYNSSDWTAEGYTINTYSSCSSAKSFIQGNTSGKQVVRITATCALEWLGDENLTMEGDLAIISNGSFKLDSNAHFTSSGGTPRSLHLMFGYGSTPPSCSYGISMFSNSYISSSLNTLMWTPCKVENNSNSFVGAGQIFAGTVDFNSNSSLTYKEISVPGVTTSTGLFDEDIVYIREILTGSA